MPNFKINRKFYGFIFFAITISSKGFASTFTNKFIEINLPDNWKCTQVGGSEWECSNSQLSKKVDLFIVISARRVKNQKDYITKFKSKLSAPIKYATNDQMIYPKVPLVFTKVVNINGQQWIDSFYSETVIPTFYTRYLTTLKQNIGIAVSILSEVKRHKQNVLQIDGIINSMKVFYRPNGPVTPSEPVQNIASTPPASAPVIEVPANIETHTESAFKEQKPIEQKKKIPLNLVIAATVAALAGIFIWKKRRDN